jgi:hypothetical protein
MKIKKDITVTFTEAEARWLVSFMQNYPEDWDPETDESFAYRQELFAALQDRLFTHVDV